MAHETAPLSRFLATAVLNGSWAFWTAPSASSVPARACDASTESSSESSSESPLRRAGLRPNSPAVTESVWQSDVPSQDCETAAGKTAAHGSTCLRPSARNEGPKHGSMGARRRAEASAPA
ncbi:MAG: hypothetical protein IIB36_15220 [Gemmatimonadetes bacterium]|nr:hypothetical protein [Gemmatimonadota bacterium]